MLDRQTKARPVDLAELIQDIHRDGITGSIGWVAGECWPVAIGQASKRAEGVCETFDEAVEWLRAKAVECYPDSRVAAKYRRGFE